MLFHSVFFSLNDASPAATEALIAACRKYLADIPGVAHFSVGTLTPDLARPVNDRDFDVALHVVFDSRASHDRYQTDPNHLKFIEECKPNWKKVRIFDADVESV